MRKRTMLAYAILIIGALASFVCYNRLSVLLPMRDEGAVTHTQALVSDVTTPMIKKGEVASDVKSRVNFHFTAGGQQVKGGFSARGQAGEAVPEKGGSVKIVYLNANPYIFLRAEEYEALPRQLSALRWMMIIFALVAIILPFVVLGTAKR